MNMPSLCDMNSDFKISKVKRDSTQKQQDPHVHSYCENFYLINGDCTFFVGHNIYKLNRGDLIIVPEGELHKSTYPEKGYSERFVVCCKEAILNWLKQLAGEEIVKESLTAGVISIPENRRDYIEKMMDNMLMEYQGQDVLSPAFVRTELLEMLLFIIRCRRCGQNVIKEFDTDKQLIQEIATYVYENYNKRLSLEETARRFHISRSFLSKKFKTVTGFGFKEYIVNIRIKNACRLLLETKLSITDIAFECGFNDSNYFGDAFRHMKGVSPNKYRKNNELV